MLSWFYIYKLWVIYVYSYVARRVYIQIWVFWVNVVVVLVCWYAVQAIMQGLWYRIVMIGFKKLIINLDWSLKIQNMF